MPIGLKSGSINLLELSGPVREYNGIASSIKLIAMLYLFSSRFGPAFAIDLTMLIFVTPLVTSCDLFLFSFSMRFHLWVVI
jgi:hypothetical protein